MFGTSGIRGPVGETMTVELAVNVGRAVASEGAERVIVGRDARETGEAFVDGVAAGLRECGADVIDLGPAATPTVARAVNWRNSDAGIAVTASHNPPPDNGLKLWTPSGQAYTAEEREAIATRVEQRQFHFAGWDGFGDRTGWAGAEDRHVSAVLAALDGGRAGDETATNNLHVVVDVGNGVGAVTTRALSELGCRVTTLNGQRDGSFPGRPSEPTAANCQMLMAYVRESDADLGIAHDGDADRMLAVDETGTWVNGDALLALFGRATAGAGDRIAAPVNTSMAVDESLKAVGAELSRTKVGDVFVAERCSESSVVFGGEPSGAWIWPAESLCPDGSLAACHLLALVRRAGPLGELVADLPSYPIERSSVEVPSASQSDVMSAVEREIRATHEEVTAMDGIRVTTDDGWFLVRPSGTQPLIRVTAQADTQERTRTLAQAATEIVESAID